VRYFFINYKFGKKEVKYCPTENIAADMFTNRCR